MKSLLACFTLCLIAAHLHAEPANPANQEAFKNYWYSGLAELTRYELQQNRYNETRPGNAVLIFVTEDFLTDKHVKHEFGDGPSESTLKLNFTREFLTGLYPYSLMTSIFTPINPERPHTFKVTSSAQEWCGHTFFQLNHQDGQFQGILRSYFQREGDQNFTLKDALLEDEVWTKIRLTPDHLPTGEIEIIPGAQYLRFTHRPVALQSATATLKTKTDPELSPKKLNVYHIEYKDVPRTLSITFEAPFPHAIVAWEESYAQRRRGNDNWVTTIGKKTHPIQLDYWRRNAVVDSVYRMQLGLK